MFRDEVLANLSSIRAVVEEALGDAELKCISDGAGYLSISGGASSLSSERQKLLHELEAAEAESRRREDALRSQFHATQMEMSECEAAARRQVASLTREKSSLAQQVAFLEMSMRELESSMDVKLSDEDYGKEITSLKISVRELEKSIGHPSLEQKSDEVFQTLFRESTKVQLVELLLDCTGELDESNRALTKLRRKAEDNAALRQLVREGQRREELAAEELEKLLVQKSELADNLEKTRREVEQLQVDMLRSRRELEMAQDPLKSLVEKLQGDLRVSDERLKENCAKSADMESLCKRMQKELQTHYTNAASATEQIGRLQTTGRMILEEVSEHPSLISVLKPATLKKAASQFFPNKSRVYSLAKTLQGESESKAESSISSAEEERRFSSDDDDDDDDDGDDDDEEESFSTGDKSADAQELVTQHNFPLPSLAPSSPPSSAPLHLNSDVDDELRTIEEEEEDETEEEEEKEIPVCTEEDGDNFGVVAAAAATHPLQKRRRHHMRAPSNLPASFANFGSGSNALRARSATDYGMAEGTTLLAIEVGSSKIRFGVIDMKGDGSLYDEFPACLARPKKSGTDAFELVHMASGLSAGMYSRFRAEGVFVGGDAWFCAMDHPDAGLRASLDLSWPILQKQFCGNEAEMMGASDAFQDFVRLVANAITTNKLDSSSTPMIITYKPDLDSERVCALGREILDAFQVPALRLVNEASVTAMAAEISTGLVVDIGMGSSYCSPIYEGCCLTHSVRSEKVGGTHIDQFMDYMLLTRTIEGYNQMVDRRRLNYARALKEEQCYVSQDFEGEVERAGRFQRKSMKVFGMSPRNSLISKSYMPYSTEGSDSDRDDPVEVTLLQKNGEELVMKLGRERFHAPEILFRPGLWEGSEHSLGLGELVASVVESCDPEIRPHLLKDIVVTGSSSKIDGLLPRLQSEIDQALPERLQGILRVRVAAPTLPFPCESCVVRGAEILFEREMNCHTSWILHDDYCRDSSVVKRTYYFGAD